MNDIKKYKCIHLADRKDNDRLCPAIEKLKELDEDLTTVYLSGFYDGEAKWKNIILEEKQRLQNKVSQLTDKEGNYIGGIDTLARLDEIDVILERSK